MTIIRTKKEVRLDSQTISILKIQAEKQGLQLEDFMEEVLKEKANSFELTDEYKSMMDELLEKHYNGQSKSISEEEFRRLTTQI